MRAAECGGGAVTAAPPERLPAAALAGSAVWYIVPWRGLVLPPPGGVPYFATISGDAMMADCPRSSVVIVVGTLSSSTQTYSGSLGTSPKRGFLISSQRVSADLIATDGSPGEGTPSTWRTPAQPGSARSSASDSVRRGFIPGPMTAHKIAQTRQS